MEKLKKVMKEYMLLFSKDLQGICEDNKIVKEEIKQYFKDKIIEFEL